MNRKLNLFENLNDSLSESVTNEDTVNTSIFQSDTRDLFNMQVSVYKIFYFILFNFNIFINYLISLQTY